MPCIRLDHLTISIHAPRTGSDAAAAEKAGVTIGISIHAPRTGSDGIRSMVIFASSRFQSTLPARGATPAPLRICSALRISIHAPRTGSDEFDPTFYRYKLNFNPRSPHGERHQPLLMMG